MTKELALKNSNITLVEYDVSFDKLTGDNILQKIIVFEHYVKKKGVETLSKKYSISPLDLRYFLNSTEAYNIYLKEKEAALNIPVIDSVEELKEFLIDKTMDFLNNCTSSQAVEIVEKFIPQILNLHSSINNSPINAIAARSVEYVEFEEEKNEIDGENYSKIQLISAQPKLYTDEELKEIPTEKKDEPNNN